MDSTSTVNAVLPLLKKAAAIQSSTEREEEGHLLEDLAIQHANCYDFSSSAKQSEFKPLFEALMHNRFLNMTHGASAAGRLRVVQSLRLLTRDARFRKAFVSLGGVQVLASLTDSLTQEHFEQFQAQGSLSLEILTECASIIKKLAAEERCFKELGDAGLPSILLRLLHTTDPALLPLVLVALIGLATSSEYADSLFSTPTSSESLDVLLRMLEEYELPYKRLAADLLSLTTRRKSVRRDLLAINPFGKILGQVSSSRDPKLSQTLLRVLNHMAMDQESTSEIYHSGGIPVIVSLLSPAPVGGSASSSPEAQMLLTPNRIAEVQSVCLLISRLSEDDDCAYQIRQCNGVYLLGKQLLVLQQQLRRTSPGADASELEEQAAVLKAHIFMALRFIFSMERNRKVFKRLFPPAFFAAFIDIGHYQFSLLQYTDLVQRWDALGDKEVQAASQALEDINLFKGGAQRRVRDYVIIEMLGKGAFGAVYKARRQGSSSMVAIKELPLNDTHLFGLTDDEKEEEVSKLTQEVKILSQLSHPNIVAYYESFVEEGCLWIVMEVVEGLSLLDYCAGLAEKGRRMPEADIWRVFVGLVMAVNYIHKEKGIVHRDITPGNIVLGHGREGLRQVKIADFGLAKQKAKGATDALMHSMVGTMPYTCPEIVQQENYTEKADIWSLGCCLYFMCMLHGPFEGSNPLQVASKIVEGSYPPITASEDSNPYSQQLIDTVRRLLTTNPDKRPDIREVQAMSSNHLLKELTNLSATCSKLKATLEYERNKSREDREVQTRKEEAFKRLVSFGMRSPDTPQRQELSVSSPPGSLSPLRTPSARLPPLAGANNSLPGSPQVRRLIDNPSSSGLDSGGPNDSFSLKPRSAGGSDEAEHRGSNGREPIKINQNRLRPVVDPLAQLLHQLHKLIWIEQLPPGSLRDSRRREVVAFKRYLFSSKQNAGSIKSMLVRLQAGGPELVAQFSGMEEKNRRTSTGSSNGDHGMAASDGSGSAENRQVTYEYLRQLIEELARDSGFYEALRDEVT